MSSWLTRMSIVATFYLIANCLASAAVPKLIRNYVACVIAKFISIFDTFQATKYYLQHFQRAAHTLALHCSTRRVLMKWLRKLYFKSFCFFVVVWARIASSTATTIVDASPKRINFSERPEPPHPIRWKWKVRKKKEDFTQLSHKTNG